ncbi:MAG: aromatic ring-hydroxylating dioxygenase subunit alpha [Rhodospirillaceae bacterium]|nr:aromatic ring-hydroxylating dioxygenase subunit alpha [Rhodospirillaceae bacterium]
MGWSTLPGWIYASDEFFALEHDAIFMSTWQIVGHLSDIPAPGDYLRFDLLDQSAIVVRNEAGRVGAFHNVCRHRAFRLLDDAQGRTQSAIRCRYHGFTYDLDGSLRTVPGEESFEGLDKTCFGLKPVDLEIWQGFIFIRFGGSGPSVAAQFAPIEAQLAPYRFDDLVPYGRAGTASIAADWKVAVDNNIEGYHIPVAHPGLQRLYGHDYRFELHPLGVSHAGGPLREVSASPWSERHYLKLLPAVDTLPEERRRFWGYYSMFPNLAFDVYPDMIDFFQILPVAPGRSMSRSRSYALPDARREMAAARWLNMRINTQTGLEDVHLVEGVQAGLGSLGYGAGPLSGREARVKQFHDLIRAAIPVAAQDMPPSPGSVADLNRSLLTNVGARAAR